MMEILASNENIYEGKLILVNNDFPLHGESAKLMPINEKYPHILLYNEAARMLECALESVKGTDGNENIVPVSGWRSKKEQTDIYESSLKENGAEFTAKFVALPDHSEHQTGLAIDLGIEKESIDFICPDFPYEGICEKFRTAAPQYGFIERYRKGKENITKIAPEPWHFRYVGFPHSAIISENDFVLEEYIEYLKQFSANGTRLEYDNDRTRFEIFYAQSEKAGSTKIMLPYHTDGAAPAYEISGNNADGFIITCAYKRGIEKGGQ